MTLAGVFVLAWGVHRTMTSADSGDPANPENVLNLTGSRSGPR